MAHLSNIYRLGQWLQWYETKTCAARVGGGTLHMKGVGKLVVSLRGVNFGFWSFFPKQRACSQASSGQNAIIFSREGLV